MKKLTTKEKILNFLNKNKGNKYAPTKIASATRSNYNTVRRCLAELFNDNTLSRNGNGLYKAFG